MYLNFKNMRRSDFWKENISDSLLNAERTFGSMLNTFKSATGASVSEGLDELYYSNSWYGENAIVLKGIFKRALLDTLVANDSNYTVTSNRNGTDIFINRENGLYFFFKDNFTICASNYLKQIDQMIGITDTSRAGLLLNQKLMDAIGSVVYKEDVWMVTNEKMFIRGAFQNLLESTSGTRMSFNDSLENDSTEADEKLSVSSLYKRMNSLSFSAKMNGNMTLLVQGKCTDAESAKYLKELVSGLLTVAKMSGGDKNESPARKLLEKMELERFADEVIVKAAVDKSDLSEFRKSPLLSNPE